MRTRSVIVPITRLSPPSPTRLRRNCSLVVSLISINYLSLQANPLGCAVRISTYQRIRWFWGENNYFVHSSLAPRLEPSQSGVSSHAAQPLALTRWRRGHMHFSPERARAVRRAPARPEWSVASAWRAECAERGEPVCRRSTGFSIEWFSI